MKLRRMHIIALLLVALMAVAVVQAPIVSAHYSTTLSKNVWPSSPKRTQTYAVWGQLTYKTHIGGNFPLDVWKPLPNRLIRVEWKYPSETYWHYFGLRHTAQDGRYYFTNVWSGDATGKTIQYKILWAGDSTTNSCYTIVTVNIGYTNPVVKVSEPYPDPGASYYVYGYVATGTGLLTNARVTISYVDSQGYGHYVTTKYTDSSGWFRFIDHAHSSKHYYIRYEGYPGYANYYYSKSNSGSRVYI